MYSIEQKNEVIKLLEDGKKIDVISKTTGISAATLYNWKKEVDIPEIPEVQDTESNSFTQMDNLAQIQSAEDIQQTSQRTAEIQLPEENSRLEQIKRKESALRKELRYMKNRLTGILIQKYIEDRSEQTLEEIEELKNQVLKEDPKDAIALGHTITTEQLQRLKDSDIDISKRENPNLQQYVTKKRELLPSSTIETDKTGTEKSSRMERTVSIVKQSASETPKKVENNFSGLMNYRFNLMEALNVGDRERTLTILKQMKEDPSIDKIAKKKINAMVELAKSTKPRSRFMLMAQAEGFDSER
ncbi:MAG: transposase [Lachnospiraceae bacterium]|nr:transposase [Lachnospiraceae bacterium]